MAPPSHQEILRGTLDLLILRTLLPGPLHGWGISRRLEQLSGDLLQVGQGSLYPALQRLEEKGWIESEWGVTEENRRAKYYSLTSRGRSALKDEIAAWRSYVETVELILRTT